MTNPTADERAGVEFAMRQGERCRNYGPDYERTENENCIVILADELERLRDLLQALCDEQNGPPLETRKEQWQRAYDQARAALDVPCKHERIQSLDTHPPMLSCMDCGADLSVTRRGEP